MHIIRLAPLLLLAALAACDSGGAVQPIQPDRSPDGPPFEVQQTQSRLLLSLPRDGEMSSAEWQKFDVFLSGAAKGNPQTVHIVIAGDPSRRLRDGLIRGAMERGVELNKIEFAPPVPGGPRLMHVELIARTYAAVMPNCPGASQFNAVGNENRVSSDFGCATVSNLALQVADPRDLVEGESGGATDSVMTTAAINRLQQDKVKKLDSQSFGLLGGGQ